MLKFLKSGWFRYQPNFKVIVIVLIITSCLSGTRGSALPLDQFHSQRLCPAYWVYFHTHTAQKKAQEWLSEFVELPLPLGSLAFPSTCSYSLFSLSGLPHTFTVVPESEAKYSGRVKAENLKILAHLFGLATGSILEKVSFSITFNPLNYISSGWFYYVFVVSSAHFFQIVNTEYFSNNM